MIETHPPFIQARGGVPSETDPGQTNWETGTIGLAWRNNQNAPRFVSAAHCTPTDQPYNPPYAGAKTPDGSIGYAAGSRQASTYAWCSGTRTSALGDLSYIDTQYWPDGSWLGRSAVSGMYDGGPTTSASVDITDWSTRGVGSQVWLSGATSGMTGPYDITAVDQTVVGRGGLCGTNATVRNQTLASRGSGPCSQGGDSGGLYYVRWSTGNVWAYGIHSAGANCEQNFTPVSRIQQQWDGIMSNPPLE